MSLENKELKKHWHYKIIGYDKVVDKKTGNVGEYCSISLSAETPEEAIKKAGEAIKKKWYRIQDMWECFEVHGLAAEMQMIQLEMQKKSLDTLKGLGHGH